MLRTPSLMIGGVECAGYVDWESSPPAWNSGWFGHGGLTVSIPAGPFTRIANAVERDAKLLLSDGGFPVFKGQVGEVGYRIGPESTIDIVGVGYFDKLKRRADYCKAWVDTDTTVWQHVENDDVVDSWGASGLSNMMVDTEGHLLMVAEYGRSYKADVGAALGYDLQTRMRDDEYIAGVKCHMRTNARGTSGSGGYENSIVWGIFSDSIVGGMDCGGTPWCDGTDAWSKDYEVELAFAEDYEAKALFLLYSVLTDFTPGVERYVEITNLQVYVNEWADHSLDEVLADIVAEYGFTASSKSGTIGDDLEHAIVRPEGGKTAAQAVEELIAQHDTPVVCAVWEEDEADIYEVPDEPARDSDLIVLSREQNPEATYNIVRQWEGRPDYVCVEYEGRQFNEIQQQPTDATWPDQWERSTTSNVTTYNDSGDLGWCFRVKSDATERNPWCDYNGPSDENAYGIDHMTALPWDRWGRSMWRYRFKARIGAYPGTGNAGAFVRSLDSAGNNLWYTKVEEWTASASSAWYTGVVNFDTDPDDIHAVDIRFRWNSVSTGAGVYSIYVNKIRLEPIGLRGPCRVYYPSLPSWDTAKDARVHVISHTGLMMTRRRALEIAEREYDRLHNRPRGGFSVPSDDLVKTGKGALMPAEHIRSHMWVRHEDEMDHETGQPADPCLVTSVSHDGVNATCGVDMPDTSPEVEGWEKTPKRYRRKKAKKSEMKYIRELRKKQQRRLRRRRKKR